MPSNYWERSLSRRRILAGGGIAVAGAASAALVGCGNDDSGDAKSQVQSSTPAPTVAILRGGTLKYPMSGVSSGNPPTLYPFENLTYLAQTVVAPFYSRLIRGANGPQVNVMDQTAIEGDIAAKWEQPDNTTFLFTLKPNVKFHDKPPMNGRLATAADFVKTWEVFSKDGQNRTVWTPVVESITAPDDKTVKIKLKAPYAPFLITHASSPEGLWFIPQETIANDQAKKDPVGTGPYVFEKFETGVAVTGRKHPGYFDAPLPNFDKLEMGLIGDGQRLVAALQAGEYDWAGLTGAIYKESHTKFDSKGTESFSQTLSTGGFYFNFDNKPWNDKRLRQALSMAMDRDGYLKVQDGTGKGDYHSFLPPGLAPYYLSPRDKNADYGANGKYWKRNVAEAKALLKAVTGQDTFKFKIFCSIDRYGQEMKEALELIQSTIKEAGFEAELVFQEYASYIQSTFLGKMPEGGVACGPYIGSPRDPDNMFQQYWSESARHNWGGSPIPEQKSIDDMIVKQRTILDNNERLKYIREMQATMSDYMQAVPYHSNGGYLYAQPWVKNFYPKSSYSAFADSYMKASFTQERINKG